MDLDDFFEFEPSHPVFGASSVTRTECSLPANLDAWDALANERGATKQRDRKRLEFAISRDFASKKLGDVEVVSLLGQLATCAPRTRIAKRVMQICGTLAIPSTSKSEWSDLLTELFGLKVDPRKYSDPMIYFWDNQLVKFLSKYPFEGYEDVAEVNALETFLTCEENNARTNKMWRQIDASHEDYSDIRRVSRRMKELMGPCPSVQDVIDKGGWGPGINADYDFDRFRTGPEYKFAATPTLTPSIIPIASVVVASIPSWDSMLNAVHGRHERFRLVPGNEFFTVPKKFKVNRGACAEAMLNVFLQKGVERVLLERLFDADHVNLRTSSMYNQVLAQVGSTTGIFCTVDLENASNNTCRTPVRAIVRHDWYRLLDALASTYGLLPSDLLKKAGRLLPGPTDGTFHRYEMLSSMGNGFTFLIETLLFRAIVTSVVPGQWMRVHGSMELTWPHVAIFGDDLVFPSAYFAKVSHLLTLFGFTVNQSKTFADGPFRESCGKDYHTGVMVRPLYISKRLDSGEAIVSLANRVLRHAFEGPSAPCSSGAVGDPRWRGVWHAVVKKLPVPTRKLITTVPHVPQGLWVPVGESTWENDVGQPMSFVVIASSPVKTDLSAEEVQNANTDDVESVAISLDSDNLMAARLSQIRGTTPASVWPAEATMRSSGNNGTLRHSVAYRPRISLVVERCRWTRWGR
jgi:hypothetical protein